VFVGAARKKPTMSSSTSSTRSDISNKVKTLLNLVDRSGVISLNDTTFRRYVLFGPRPYSVLLMVTSNSAQLPCAPCRTLTNEFKKVAVAYKHQINGKFTNLFFAIADIANCSEEITKLRDKIVGIPIIIRVGPTDSNSKQFTFNPYSDVFIGVSEASSASSIANWIDDVTGVKVAEYVTAHRTSRNSDVLRESKIATWTLLLLVLLILGLLISRFSSLFQDKTLIGFNLSCAVYFIVISGTIFNMINNPPPLHLDAHGIWWYYPAVRLHLQIEGYIIAAFHVSAAIAVVLIADWFPKQIKKGTASRRHFYGIFALAVFSMGFVLHIFKRKAPYYPFGV
jgi:hypothetical protein